MAEERRVRIVCIETDDDGTMRELQYDDVPPPMNEPQVRSRHRLEEDGVVSEIATHFEASAEPPASYPVDLPFLPLRDVWTTQSPDGSGSTGARWLCSDPDAVIATAVAASVASGWRAIDPLSPPPPGDAPAAALRRGDVTRFFHKIEIDRFRMAQLTDVIDL